MHTRVKRMGAKGCTLHMYLFCKSRHSGICLFSCSTYHFYRKENEYEFHSEFKCFIKQSYMARNFLCGSIYVLLVSLVYMAVDSHHNGNVDYVQF
mmetsp:Transcript_31038/g.75008  ORF Transcript_31038/g.75008 Transcript_31038/m.75008 type:complete len:95 (-) Transcript_31038:1819-2103(-)